VIWWYYVGPTELSYDRVAVGDDDILGSYCEWFLFHSNPIIYSY